MKKLKEVYRLKFELGYSNRQIGRIVRLSPGTVSDHITLFKASGLSWEAMASLNEDELEQLIYRHPKANITHRPLPD